MISLMVEQSLKREIQELDDVTVHIDPEDDEKAPPCLGLPTRSRVITILDDLWRDYPSLQVRSRLVLHYLNGKIHLDVYLPLDSIPDIGLHKSLQRDLQQSVAGHEEFGYVRAFFQ